MKTIPLTQGKVALVDDRFHKRLVQMGPWHAANKQRKTWYARNHQGSDMHRIVMELATGKCPHRVDHRNQNGLDNQLGNLRSATQIQNMQNRGPNRNNKSGFKGVTEDKCRQKWLAQIQVNQRHCSLGRFCTKRAAARAYNDAARKYFGEFAWLNRIEQRRKQNVLVAVEQRSSDERRAQC